MLPKVIANEKCLGHCDFRRVIAWYYRTITFVRELTHPSHESGLIVGNSAVGDLDTPRR